MLFGILQQLRLHGSSAQLITDTIAELTRSVTVYIATDINECRQEMSVQKCELKNGILARWEDNMEQYQEALKISINNKQKKLKRPMLELVRERMFYQSIIKHHASEYNIICIDNQPINILNSTKYY